MDSCMKRVDIFSKTSFDKDLEICFDYVLLSMSQKKKEGEERNLLQDTNEGMENTSTNTKKLPETQNLLFISQINEHCHLMSHPLVTSFIWMKWRKMRPYFYINVIFCLLSSVLLSPNCLGPDEDPIRG